jgi:hypothetical protein
MEQTNNKYKSMNMKKILLFFTIMLCAISAQAQKEAYNWTFGYGVGITWNITDQNRYVEGVAGTGALTTSRLSNFPTFFNSSISTWEGCLTMSDGPTGNLLFYSDGTKVWDRIGRVMKNLTDTGVNLLGHNSSTQSGIIFPYPGNANKYILVTMGAVEQQPSPVAAYSVIDMSLSSGYGDVVATQKNIIFSGWSGATVNEQVSAVKIPGSNDYWIVFPGKAYSGPAQGYFNAYRVTSSGVTGTPVKTNVYNTLGIPFEGTGASGNSTGYLKFSQDGKRFAMCNGQRLFYGNFDTGTGSFTNLRCYTYPKVNNVQLLAYGCEFSPDGKLLYVERERASTDIYGPLFVYDTDWMYTNSIDYVPANKMATYNIGALKWGAIQAAVDGRIYMIKGDGNGGLFCISDPNNMTSPKIYSTGSQDLFTYPAKSGIGLPSFPPGYFICPAGNVAPTLSSAAASPCLGTTINLNSYVTSAIPANSSLKWRDAGGTLIANPTTVSVTGTTAQTYTVTYDAVTCASPSATFTVTGIDCACYKPAATTGSIEPIKTIISTLDRVAVPRNYSDPRAGSLILESKTRGMVLTRVANPQTAIATPVEGMIVFDTTANVLKFYNGTTWKVLEQGCPDN